MRRAVIAASILFMACGYTTHASAAKLPELEKVSSLVTTGAESISFKREPMTSFSMADTIWYFTTVRWEPIDKPAGRRKLTWRWYIGDRLISEIKQTVVFKPTPFELRATMLGTAIGAGHAKVEVLIDGVSFDSQEFEVTR